MDIAEASGTDAPRHPWEVARLATVRHILRRLTPTSAKPLSILDVGCGDGFVASRLFDEATVDAVDPELTATAMARLPQLPGLTYHTGYETLGERRYDLILLLDVIEHVDDDAGMIGDLVADRLKPGGAILTTVPAYRSLFGAHDLFLKHHRRYNVTQLRETLTKGGATVVASGYFFGSLLIPRLLSVAAQRLIPGWGRNPVGVGDWRGGATLGRLLTCWFTLENRLYYRLGRAGVVLPGLSAWALCEKR